MNTSANEMPETVPGTSSTVIKAKVIGAGAGNMRDGTEFSNVLQTPEDHREIYQDKGAVNPLMDPLQMAHLYEMSGALRSNIDAYAVNVDGFGHRFEPLIDLTSSGAFEHVKTAMIQERLLGLDRNLENTDDVDKVISILKSPTGYSLKDKVPDPGALPEPSDKEVNDRMASLQREMMLERLVAERFFAFCTADKSFEKLRMETRQDIETTGNGYWEVLRNKENGIVQFNFVPGFSVRLMPQENKPQTVQMASRATIITPMTEPVQKRFRKFVQINNRSVKGNSVNRLIWFKEFGDPRVYSHETGTEYKDADELEVKEPGVTPATEIIHFKIHNSRSPYGLPRWISELLAVVGSRQAEEINLAYFDNKSIPPMAICVSGGHLVEEDVSKLENFFKNEVRGKKNFHKIVILQAESAAHATPGMSSGTCKIDIKPLNHVQEHDAQFMKYMERNTDSIGSVFRLPRLLRGDARDFNRATAQTSLEFTEQQVFGPLRKDFDFYMNRCILPELGVNYWKYRSKGPEFADPTQLLEALAKTAEANYLTPNELRGLAQEAFGVDFERKEEDWASRPAAFTLAGISTAQTTPDGATAAEKEPPGEGDNANAAEDNDLAKLALVEITKHFADKGYSLTIEDAADSTKSE